MGASELASFLPIILVFAFFYFFVIRPQSKQQKKVQNMRKSLEKGDKIMTIGGFYGEIFGFKDDALIVQLKPDNIKVQMSRSAVADVLNKDVSDYVEEKPTRTETE
ncbi:preprotein translocase subunit YajC [Alkalibacter rhizosphaerae]|uniref:Preprotein translocase subunit YajC n=1 Tax=Alkalibacter rhizosphaerae TaxID=2815577 RepID=A0A974XFJ7_9FIRM|nr:preprotein translocase subunit YajC [Alkalibacter rhizosphaerae]QSX08781.1 preprotein translocase subunit YajC [Alkalibacter rhizosphaerae]